MIRNYFYLLLNVQSSLEVKASSHTLKYKTFEEAEEAFEYLNSKSTHMVERLYDHEAINDQTAGTRSDIDMTPKPVF